MMTYKLEPGEDWHTYCDGYQVRFYNNTRHTLILEAETNEQGDTLVTKVRITEKEQSAKSN